MKNCGSKRRSNSGNPNKVDKLKQERENRKRKLQVHTNTRSNWEYPNCHTAKPFTASTDLRLWYSSCFRPGNCQMSEKFIEAACRPLQGIVLATRSGMQMSLYMGWWMSLHQLTSVSPDVTILPVSPKDVWHKQIFDATLDR